MFKGENAMIPILALIVGVLLNMSTSGGQVWPIGSVIAVVIMGVWLKGHIDRRFDALEAKLKKNLSENLEEK